MLFFAWIPILWVESDFSVHKKRGCWKYYALTFLLWNIFTTYWIYKATLWGGIAAIIGNSFQMFLVFALFRVVKRKIGNYLGYIFLIVLWIAWEYYYFNSEASWPWLVLGSGFSETTFLVQWYEFTGVLGGSLWVFLSGISIFKVIKSKKMIVIPSLIIALPIVLSLYIFFTFKEKHDPIEVVVLQPNIDPYYEKFDSMSQEEQDARLIGLAEDAITPATRYIFAPETAIDQVVENDLLHSTSLDRFHDFLSSYPHTAFVVGAVSYYFFPPSQVAPNETAYRYSSDSWYNKFNSAFQLYDGALPLVYHKSKLVPGVEIQPYARYLKFINNLAIDLGGALGSFTSQPEATVFPVPWNNIDSLSFPNPRNIGVAVCYESIYGEYFASWVKKGAGLMAVITNDGWWGDTPGYRQHLTFSRLRAIETRRSITRSANTGISALINQRGDYVQTTKWWTKTYLRGELNINHKLTFYVRYGDYIGKGAVYLMAILLLYWVVLLFRFKNRR
jgi:apolipoprotein N-acyltransferase